MEESIYVISSYYHDKKYRNWDWLRSNRIRVSMNDSIRVSPSQTSAELAASIYDWLYLRGFVCRLHPHLQMVDAIDVSKRKKSYTVRELSSLPDMNDVNLWLSSVDRKYYKLTGRCLLLEDRLKSGKQDEQVTLEEVPWLGLSFIKWSKQNK